MDTITVAKTIILETLGDKIFIARIYSRLEISMLSDIEIYNKVIENNNCFYETTKDKYEDLKLKLKESFEIKCDKMCLLKTNMYSTHSNWIYTIESNDEWDREEIIKTKKEINDKIKEIDKKCKIEEIEDVLKQKKNKINENKINKYKKEIENKEKEIKIYETHIEAEKIEIERYEKEIRKIKEENNVNYKEQIEMIKNNKKVENVYYEPIENKLVIDTVELRMTNEDIKDDIRALGKMRIKIDIGDFSTKMFNLTNKRTNYWGEQGNHPHVNSSGNACLGNSDYMLAQAKEENNFYITFLICLGYLETYDYLDCAGAYYVSWDKIDKDGYIIEEGHLPYDVYECAVCGAIIDEDDAYYCPQCGEYVCDEHTYYIESDDAYVCQNCIDLYYSKCDCCGEYERTEYTTELENGDIYCSNCAEEYLGTCEHCGALVNASDLIEVTKNEMETMLICEACYNQIMEQEEE